MHSLLSKRLVQNQLIHVKLRLLSQHRTDVQHPKLFLFTFSQMPVISAEIIKVPKGVLGRGGVEESLQTDSMQNEGGPSFFSET